MVENKCVFVFSANFIPNYLTLTTNKGETAHLSMTLHSHEKRDVTWKYNGKKMWKTKGDWRKSKSHWKTIRKKKIHTGWSWKYWRNKNRHWMYSVPWMFFHVSLSGNYYYMTHWNEVINRTVTLTVENASLANQGIYSASYFGDSPLNGAWMRLIVRGLLNSYILLLLCSCHCFHGSHVMQ